MTEKPRSQRRSPAGFTLIELLVVVAIIALLVSILLPTLGRAKELARRAACGGHQHAIGEAWHIYFAGNNSRIPPLLTDQHEPAGGYHFCTFYYNVPVANGYLYATKILSDDNLMLGCPSYVANGGMAHWNPSIPVTQAITRAAAGGTGLYSRSVWNFRSMKFFNDPNLAAPPASNPLMLRNNSADSVLKSDVTSGGQPARSNQSASTFSIMSDRVSSGPDAKFNHPPGVNVLYLDAHVSYFQDTTPNTTILYNNGIIDDWSPGGNDNWDTEGAWPYAQIFLAFDQATGFYPLPK